MEKSWWEKKVKRTSNDLEEWNSTRCRSEAKCQLVQTSYIERIELFLFLPYNNARYRKTVATAIWVEVTLIAWYLPYSIVIATITIHGSSPFLDTVWQSTVSLLCLNSSFNPVLYCWKIKEVKQEVKNTIRQFFLFVKLVRWKLMNASVYVALNIS